jgi:DNA protecting protein DprA
MSDQLLYQIAITLVRGLGYVNGKRLVAYCGGPEAVFKESKKSLEKISGIRAMSVEDIYSSEIMVRAEKEVEYIINNNICPLFYLDPNYPKRLQQCADSPLMLYYKGNVSLNAKRVLAIVGTRNITEYGRMNCESLVESLVDDDVLIISGLAYGVDTVAHRSSLKNNIPTVGVLGHGLQQIYPAVNKKMAQEMQGNGGILTEFMSGELPDREHFPQRNRIIAGMADAVVVIESALKGGSLITADLANSYNRDVFAYPGKINDLYSQGCNYLIRTNRANLMENADNLRYVMQWDAQTKPAVQTKLFRDFSDDEKKIMACFGDEKMINIDQIIVATEMPTTKIASLLLTLEFDGILTALPGKRYQKTESIFEKSSQHHIDFACDCRLGLVLHLAFWSVIFHDLFVLWFVGFC